MTAIQFESFVVEQEENGRFQGRTFDGKLREFGIQLVRDLARHPHLIRLPAHVEGSVASPR